MRLIGFAFIIFACVISAGCGHTITKQDVGTVGGGVAGGYVGNAFTGGSTLGTIGGTLGGAYIGNQVAKNIN
ncbi:MAG TPA: glycine zipper 2TM domain-containing protein [Gammaproteobacteria bacterium]|nr:glycine zipper 2TM domain-containing protein [Gammaproteobacteria bacterium]